MTALAETANTLKLRPAELADTAELARICYEAFKVISQQHNFPEDFPSPAPVVGLMEMMVARPDVYSVAAEQDGKLLGSNFLWTSDAVAGVGPITVDPVSQNAAVGRTLMNDVLQHADAVGSASVRLVQAAYHNRSLSLYTKLGFDTVEPLSLIQGTPIGVSVDGHKVRTMTAEDLEAADALAHRVHGHSRRNETAAAVDHGTAAVVENGGRITGYTTGVGFFGHSVGESNRDLQALIGAAEVFAGPGFLLPTRNSELMRWCLAHGLKIVQPMTLMSRGLYQEPRGAFLPSILF